MKKCALKEVYERIESMDLNDLPDFESSMLELSALSDVYDFISAVGEEPKYDIPGLKKQIKYCKNPLERKNLEKKLNEAYKEKKKNGKL